MALIKPEQPTAASKHEIEEDTREARGRHSKQAATAPPTTKLSFKMPMYANAAVTAGVAPHTTPDRACIFEVGFRTNLFGIAVRVAWPTATEC